MRHIIAGGLLFVEISDALLFVATYRNFDIGVGFLW